MKQKVFEKINYKTDILEERLEIPMRIHTIKYDTILHTI